VNENSPWSLVVDLAPLIIFIAFIAVVGWVFIRSASVEVRKAKGGRFFRAYQIYLLIILILVMWQLGKTLNHLRERRAGQHGAAQSGTPPG
jgi:hypothetical protein